MAAVAACTAATTAAWVSEDRHLGVNHHNHALSPHAGHHRPGHHRRSQVNHEVTRHDTILLGQLSTMERKLDELTRLVTKLGDRGLSSAATCHTLSHTVSERVRPASPPDSSPATSPRESVGGASPRVPELPGTLVEPVQAPVVPQPPGLATCPRLPETGLDASTTTMTCNGEGVEKKLSQPSSPSPQKSLFEAGRRSITNGWGMKGAKTKSATSLSPVESRTPRMSTKIKLEQVGKTVGHESRHTVIVAKVLADPISSTNGTIFSQFMPPFAVGSAIFTLAQTMKGSRLRGFFPACIELLFETLFILEFCARLVVSHNRRRFFLNIFNHLDFLAGLPIVFRIGCGVVLDDVEEGQFCWVMLYCITPIVRLLKALRHFATFKLLLRAFKLASEALPALLFLLAANTLVFATVIYVVEPRENIESLPKAVWLVIVTTTTVGYGDVVPESTVGAVACTILIICSVLYFAIPLGTVGNSFMQVWTCRDRYLLMQSMRERLEDWGWEADDMPELFRQFDSDGNGELDMEEFRDMVNQMGLHLSEERCLDLFDIFDEDRSGVIDDVEFVRVMYPEAFQSLYKHHKELDSQQLGDRRSYASGRSSVTVLTGDA